MKNNFVCTITTRAEIALFTRSVVIRGDASSVQTGYGGQTVYHGGVDMLVRITYVELTQMG